MACRINDCETLRSYFLRSRRGLNGLSEGILRINITAEQCADKPSSEGKGDGQFVFH